MVIGDTGSGKTSLIRAIGGQLHSKKKIKVKLASDFAYCPSNP